MESKRRRREAAASSSSLGPSLSLSRYASDDVDRLTALPDVLRLHILTLLPLKFAIRTGTLSSQWRGLWKYRWPKPSLLQINSVVSLSYMEFVSLIDDFFGCRNMACLDCVEIMFSPTPDQIPDLKRWLGYAASCCVSDLHLDLSPAPISPNPPRRRGSRAITAAAAPVLDFNLRSPSLTRLTLRGFHLSSSPPSFRTLSYSLEILSLSEVYLSYASLRRILVNCPLLRSLSIHRCQDLKKVVVPVTATRLTRLSVVDCRKTNEISVSGLGLRSFRFSGVLLKNYHIQCASMLEDVYISSGLTVPAMPRGDWLSPLGKMASLRVLTVCSIALESIVALSAGKMAGFCLFPNLVELQLLMMMMAESNLWDIYGFLKYCPVPRLERLFLELPMSASDPRMTMYLEVPREEPPKNGFNNLKVVKMKGFKGHLNEMELASVLLMNSINLENFITVVPLRGNNGDKCESSTGNLLSYISARVSLLPRVSPKAHVVSIDQDTPRFQPVHCQV